VNVRRYKTLRTPAGWEVYAEREDGYLERLASLKVNEFHAVRAYLLATYAHEVGASLCNVRAKEVQRPGSMWRNLEFRRVV
jgi:hypothetical protein